MNKQELEAFIREILRQQLAAPQVKAVDLHSVFLNEKDALDTKTPNQQVFTRDLLTLEESPRLGAGLMEMRESDFPWHLDYDEIDYVIDGHLTIATERGIAEAGPGQMIFIPKGSDIRFQAKNYARFLYVTYPADWQQA